MDLQTSNPIFPGSLTRSQPIAAPTVGDVLCPLEALKVQLLGTCGVICILGPSVAGSSGVHLSGTWWRARCDLYNNFWPHLAKVRRNSKSVFLFPRIFIEYEYNNNSRLLLYYFQVTFGYFGFPNCPKPWYPYIFVFLGSPIIGQQMPMILSKLTLFSQLFCVRAAPKNQYIENLF